MRCTNTSVAAASIERRTSTRGGERIDLGANHSALLAEREQVAQPLVRHLVDAVQPLARVGVALGELEQHEIEAALAAQSLVARAAGLGEGGARVARRGSARVVLSCAAASSRSPQSSISASSSARLSGKW